MTNFMSALDDGLSLLLLAALTQQSLKMRMPIKMVH